MSINKFIERMSLNKLLRTSSLLVFAGIAAGMLGYVYQVVMGRMLTPADYGLFSAIMAVFMIAASPMNTLMMLVSRKVAEYGALAQTSQLPGFYQTINAKSIKWVLIVVASLLFFTQYLMDYLKTENPMHIILLGLLIVLSVPSVTTMGFVQGMHRFREFAAAQFLVALTKIFFSVLLVWLGYGVSGAAMGVLLSLAVIAYWLHSRLSIPLFPNVRPTASTNHLTARESVPVFVANSAFTAMVYMDIVFVNYYFSSEESGAYAAASILGKAVMYLPAGIAQAMYPMVVTLHSRQEKDVSILIHALVIVLALSLFGGFFYFLLSDQIIFILFGADYSKSAEILKYYGLAILPLTLIMVAENYLIAKSQVLFAYLFGLALPFQILAVYYYHESMISIVVIMGSTGVIVSLMGFLLLWLHHRKGAL